MRKRYKIEWHDFTGVVNQRLSDATPAPCWSEGLLVRDEPDYLVLASSQYRGEGDNPTGDYTCLIKGACVSCKRL